MAKIKDGTGPFLTIGEIARQLGVSSEMVRVHERLGRLYGFKLATGERLFLKMEVERFLKNRERRPGARRRGRRP